MTHCENCGISDSDKEVRLSDTAPDTWLCQACFELNPHHSAWHYLKQRPYKEQHNININTEMNREAIEHLIDLLHEDLNRGMLDLENNSIDDIVFLKEKLEESLGED